tara:strand:+ start:240 stop:668 length:429 start_codon:yes stop_codon:yes gene_type:complete
MNNEEITIFEGSPSHWTAFISYAISVVLIPVYGLGVLVGLWTYLKIRTTKIKITSQRVIEEKGVLSKATDELELFRVKDIQLNQPLWLRMVGLSNILLITSDKTSGVVLIGGVKDGKQLREQIRSAVDNRRDEKGVRETDFS